MRKPLDGQVIVITGASNGIGRCTAQCLAARCPGRGDRPGQARRPVQQPVLRSEGGIDGLTGALCAELRGSGVHISTRYPPTVDTPIYGNARGKLGVVPKPAAPIADPIQAAREIADLAETGERSRFFG